MPDPTPVVADLVAPVVAEVTPPVTTTTETPAVANPTEITEVRSISDAIAVKLGEKKVVPAKAADTDPEIETEIATVTKDLSPKQREAFTKKTYELRDLNRKLKESEAITAKLAEAETKLKDFEAKLAEKKDPSAEMQAKLAEYEREVAAVRIEKTEKFQKEITEPLTKAEEVVKRIAKGNEIDPAKLLDLLSYTGDDRNRKLAEAIHDLNELDKHDFVAAVRSVEGIHAKRTDLLTNAKAELDNYSAAQSKAQADAAAARRQEYDAAQPVAWEGVKKMVPMLAPVENNAAWNQQLEAAERFAQHDFNALDTSSQVTVMQRAGAFPLAAGVIAHQQSQIKALESDLARLRGAAPSDAGHRANPAAAADSKMSFNDAVSKKLRERGIS